MKYKIALGVLGTVIAFQGVMAVQDVGVYNTQTCAKCHAAGGGARQLTAKEMAAGAPQDTNHQSGEVKLGRLRVEAALKHDRTRRGNESAKKLA